MSKLDSHVQNLEAAYLALTYYRTVHSPYILHLHLSMNKALILG